VTGTTTEARPARVAQRAPRRSDGSARIPWLAHPRTEPLLIVLLVLGALAVRWPYLMRLPHFTDETVEMRWALSIWRGERLPLTASDAYYGPLHAYLVAACLWLFGPHMALPRLLVMLLGTLTVVATYLLGRELAGRGAGLLAAALLATSPQHVVVNSHVAWQNSTTPLYTTLCLWALARALNRASADCGSWGSGGCWLVLAGLLYGLALQTHVGMIVLAPALVAAALGALAARRAWRLLRAPWPYASLAAALAGYSPVIVHNLTHRLAGVVRVQTRRNYAYEMHPSWASYRHNLGNLLLELLRMLSNPMRLPERPLHYFTSPYLLVAAGLCLLGLALLARRGRPLPLLALASAAAVMPYFNRAYGVEGDRYLLTGRYVAYLLPPLVVAAAAGALALAGAALRAVPRRWRAPAGAVPAVLTGLLVLYPLQPLARYYTHEAANDPANATFLETVRLLDAARGPRTPIWLDGYLGKIDLNDGAEAHDILDYLLILNRTPHRTVEDPGAELRRVVPMLDPADREAWPLVVMPRDRCWPLRDEIALERIGDPLVLNELYRYYGVYRAMPGAPLGRCLPLSQ
jgi:4-amino-4-deoxy-L-arabinose transferase-like glycosyltransferase